MVKHGVKLQKAYSGTLHLSRTNAFFLGGHTGFPIKSSEGTIKDVVEMTLEGLSLLEDVIKGASQFE
jgi:hypothetical protein